MIFKPELAKKILKREKTQTRRIVKPGEYLLATVSGVKSVHGKLDKKKWQTGQTYAIQPGRTKAAIGRFKLLDIRRERLQDIKPGDATDEGIDDLPGIWKGIGDQGIIVPQDFCKAFFNLWNSLNIKPGQRVEDNPEVWVLVFEVVKPAQ